MDVDPRADGSVSVLSLHLMRLAFVELRYAKSSGRAVYLGVSSFLAQIHDAGC